MGCNWSNPFSDTSTVPQPISGGSVCSHPPSRRSPASDTSLLSDHYNTHGYVDSSDEEDRTPRLQNFYTSLQSDHYNTHGYVEESNKDAENCFFRTFFSVLDRVPGYHGTLQRWKNDTQRAAEEGTHLLKWDYIWRVDNIGYLKTLRQVQDCVQEDQFTSADLVKLLGWAKEVVEQRRWEYQQAQHSGRANWSHQKVLQAWTVVVDTLEDIE